MLKYLMIFLVATSAYSWDQKNWTKCMKVEAKKCGPGKLPKDGKDLTEEQKALFVCRLKAFIKCNEKYPPNE